eukprot:g79989.t1
MNVGGRLRFFQRPANVVGGGHCVAQAVGRTHDECHAAILRRGSNGGRVSGRVQNGAAWAAGLLRRTEGAFSIADMQRTGAFNQDTLVWQNDEKCTTIWADANRILLSEEWRWEDEELFVAESGEDAASRRELFNYFHAVWEVNMLTGCVRFCVVGDCAPACSCIAKAHSPTPGMQAILDIYLWLFAERNISVLAFRAERERLHIVDVLARGQVEKAARLQASGGSFVLGLRATRRPRPLTG